MQNLLLGSSKTEAIQGKALKSPVVPVGESGKASENTPGKSTFLANLMFAVEEIEKPEKILKNSGKKTDPTKMLVKETNKIAAKNEGGLANLIKTEEKGEKSLLKSFVKSVEDSEQKLMNATTQAKEKIQQRFQDAEKQVVENVRSNQPRKLSDILKLAQAKEIPLEKVQLDEAGKSSVKIRFVEPMEYKATDEKPTLKISSDLTHANNIMLSKNGSDKKLVSQHTLISAKTPEMPKALKGSVNNVLAEKPLAAEALSTEETTEKKTPFYKDSSKLSASDIGKKADNVKFSGEQGSALKEIFQDKPARKDSKAEAFSTKTLINTEVKEELHTKALHSEHTGLTSEKKSSKSVKKPQELKVEVTDTLQEKLKGRETNGKQQLHANDSLNDEKTAVQKSEKNTKTDTVVLESKDVESVDSEALLEDNEVLKKPATIQGDTLLENAENQTQSKEAGAQATTTLKEAQKVDQTEVSKSTAPSKETRITHEGNTLSKTAETDTVEEKFASVGKKDEAKEEVKHPAQKTEQSKKEPDGASLNSRQQTPILKERATPAQDLLAAKESLKPARRENLTTPKQESPLQQLIRSDFQKEPDTHKIISNEKRHGGLESLSGKVSTEGEKADSEPVRNTKTAEVSMLKESESQKQKASLRSVTEPVQMQEKKSDALRTSLMEEAQSPQQGETLKKASKETVKNSFGAEPQKGSENVQSTRQENRHATMENRITDRGQTQPLMQNEAFSEGDGSNREGMKRRFGGEAHGESVKESQKSGNGFEEIIRDAAENTSGIKAEGAKNGDLIQRMAQSRETIRNFSMQLSEEVKTYKPPISKITLELNPEKLGNVEVTITTRGNNVQVNLNSNPSAMMMLMQNNLEFKNALSNLGFNDVQMNFSSGNGGQGQKGQQEQRNGNGFYNFDDDMEGEQIEQIELILPKYI